MPPACAAERDGLSIRCRCWSPPAAISESQVYTSEESRKLGDAAQRAAEAKQRSWDLKMKEEGGFASAGVDAIEGSTAAKASVAAMTSYGRPGFVDTWAMRCIIFPRPERGAALYPSSVAPPPCGFER